MTIPTDPLTKDKAPSRAGSPPNTAAADLQSAFGPEAMDPHENIDDGRNGGRAADDSARVDTVPDKGEPAPAHLTCDPLAMNPGIRTSSGRPPESREVAKAKSVRVAKRKDPGAVEEDDGIINF